MYVLPPGRYTLLDGQLGKCTQYEPTKKQTKKSTTNPKATTMTVRSLLVLSTLMPGAVMLAASQEFQQDNDGGDCRVCLN
jgi:hypothetical protein